MFMMSLVSNYNIVQNTKKSTLPIFFIYFAPLSSYQWNQLVLNTDCLIL